ncbi:hypothetical protein E4U58_002135 [Claviceps cyperi]|nr:hypothetical protein E4U58_002135 [Claviceps cyperi]
MALNLTIREAAATRGYASDTNFEIYSSGLLQLATEREQLPSFLNNRRTARSTISHTKNSLYYEPL